MKLKIILLCTVILTSLINGYAQLTPSQAIVFMTRGINIGNSLDAIPTETSWGNSLIQSWYFDDYKAAGFTCVRVPVTWEYHVSHTFPYTIDPVWLARVDTVVSWGLQRGLVIEINAHHEAWLKSNSNNSDSVARFDSIWSQVATHFQSKSQNLIFEILNEPDPMPQDSLNIINTEILSIIRKTNPTRIVVFSGYEYSDIAQLVATQIPSLTDQYLLGYFHSYDPYTFCGEGIGTYGDSTDIGNTTTIFNQAQGWSTTHHIPVIMDEFGAIHLCDYNSRMLYYATVVEQAHLHQIPFLAWDDNGSYQIFYRTGAGWDDAKDILCHYYPLSPNKLAISAYQSNRVKLTWNNRTTRNDTIFIDRCTDFSTYSMVGWVNSTASQFVDSTLKYNQIVYYRLRTNLADSIELYSYSIQIFANGAVASTREVSESSPGVQVFPNPANSYIIVENPLHQTANLEIFDMSGRKISTQFITGNSTTLYTDYMEEGMYLFIIRSANVVQTVKVMIQH